MFMFTRIAPKIEVYSFQNKRKKWHLTSEQLFHFTSSPLFLWQYFRVLLWLFLWQYF